jgi:LysR family transcriptional regulator, mexEF-oprN operon transcriptional activator
MQETYGRDLDLNLLRVFVVVANAGSVTRAAASLYLTQPAVSAALRRLSDTVGAPLFVRNGRGLALSQRGERLLQAAQPLLEKLVTATLAPARFDPKTSERTLRIGLSDAMGDWLLAPLLRRLADEAPHMRVITVPVQFRTVGEALASRAADLAITVADELPASIRRQQLLHGGFVCLYDPRHGRLGKRLSERDYFAREHVIVSYNGDLRGIVEDLLHKQRNVRCAVSSFSHIGAIVEGSALLATVPVLVVRHILALRPALRTAELPFAMEGTPVEMLWPAAIDDDDAYLFLREQLVKLAEPLLATTSPPRRSRGPGKPPRDRVAQRGGGPAAPPRD